MITIMKFFRKKKYLFFLTVPGLVPFYLIFSSKNDLALDYAFESDKRSSKTTYFNKTSDLIVFLHFQKTGGSDFDRHIVQYMESYDEIDKKWIPACSKTKLNDHRKKFKYKKYFCPRVKERSFSGNDFENNWYFSRQTFGWYCGLHVDYASLTSCMNEVKRRNMFLRQFHYITILRDPVKRYLSEWNHITRGGHAWNRSRNYCNQENLLSTCLPYKSTQNITLEEFISCENNIANNRQTRMLANYKTNSDGEYDCSVFNKENRKKLLINAQNVLRKLSFFALNEYQMFSQELFERTFENTLKFNFNLNQSTNETAIVLLKRLNTTIIEKIIRLNDLDLKLYEFAEKIFFKRLEFYRKKALL